MVHELLGTSRIAACDISVPRRVRARLSTAAVACAFIFAGSVLALLAPSARADTGSEVLGPNIVVNGGFERGADPGVRLFLSAGASPLLPGWTVYGNAVLYGTAWQAQEGSRSMALANPTTAMTTGAGVKQALTTTPGQKYRVIFYQAGNPNDHQPSMIHAQIGGYTHDYTYQAGTQTTRQKMDWVKRSFVYTASGASTPLSLTAAYTPGNDPLGLDNVQVRAIQSPAGTTGTPAGGPAGSATTLTVGSPAGTAGGSETLTVGAAPGAALVVVIDYPDGSQAVTQAKADPAGHYSLTLTVPTKMVGTVHVLVDSAGSAAKGSFSVS